MEEETLKLFKLGMKMTLKVCGLNVGLKFIKTIRRLVPSFHTYLPQELMTGYKVPEPNERPAPSIYDVEEDDVLSKIPIGELEDTEGGSA